MSEEQPRYSSPSVLPILKSAREAKQIDGRCVFLLVVGDLTRYRTEARGFGHLNCHVFRYVDASAPCVQLIGRICRRRHSHFTGRLLHTVRAVRPLDTRDPDVLGPGNLPAQSRRVALENSGWRAGKGQNLW